MPRKYTLSINGKLHKPEKNFQLNHLEYSEICEEYNKRYRQSAKISVNRQEKLRTLDVAGYCTKLLRLGILSVLNQRNSAEKLVVLEQHR